MDLENASGISLPRFYSAQVAIIGSMLLDPRCVGEVLDLVSEEDFGYESTRRIFAAIHGLFDRGEPVDPVTVQNRVGSAYTETLAECMRITPTAANVLEYCKILQEEADLARLKATAERILAADSAARARQIYADSLGLAAGRNKWRRLEIRDALNNLLDRLSDPAPPVFVRWGFPALDNGLQLKGGKGNFVVLGAESSVGKTALALQMAFNLAATGKRVGFYSLETDEETAYDRVFVQRAKIRLRDLRDKKISDKEFKILSGIGEALYQRPEVQMEIIECAGATVEEIRTDVLVHRFDVILIDYVQLMRDRGDKRSEIVTNISIGLHTLAQELGILVVGLSQLTPPTDGKRNPYRLNRKEDLRESKQLIHDAELIMIMSRTREDEPNFRELLIDKNKDGPCGEVELDFLPEYMLFQQHVNSKSEQYKNVLAASAKARKETAGQVVLTELSDDESGPLPF